VRPTPRRLDVKKWLAPICACLILGLAAVACGSDDEDSGGSAATTETTTTEQSGGAGGPAAAKEVAIEVVDIDYDPQDATVAKGGTVTWTNTGDIPHTVTKSDGPGADFDSETLSPGDTFEQRFDTAGTIGYVCKIHPQQTGSITVE
jgi:plastocyanin